MAFWQWWKNIHPKTRLYIGIGMMAWAGAGIVLTDKAEEHLGLVPNEKDKEELKKMLPNITVVDQQPRNK